MKAILLAAATLPSLLLGACASLPVDKPIAFNCPGFEAHRYRVSPSPVDTGPGGEAAVTKTLAQRLSRIPAPRPGAESAAAPRDRLILSGGGKWGAYGAGLIESWSRQTGEFARPNFQIVTGISTGAMQSSFVFAGSASDPALVDAYSITSESQLVKRNGPLFFLSNGSTADISPLRDYVLARLDPLLDPIAERGRRDGAVLLVGAVDALDGHLYAIDLTAIADAYQGEQRRQCYTAAIIASAAIPVIFRQITINGTPYMDGGVRQSVFLTEVQKTLAASAPPGRTFILMNGTLGVPVKSSVEASLFGTLGRTQAIVFDQIDQGAVGAVAIKAGGPAYLAQIDRDLLKREQCLEPDGTEGNDDIFNPAFMACLIKAGRKAWDIGPAFRRLTPP